MRIEQLEYIEAVTRYGSLRRTSEHLHISQPALSESISRLERDLGVVLLERRRSGVRISRRGRELLTHMTEAIEAVRRLREAASAEEGSTRVIQVGTVQAGGSTLMVPALRALRADSPQVTVELRNLQQQEIYTELAEGSLDLGLVNLLEGDDTPPDLVRTDLIHGAPVVVLGADHPLRSEDRITRDQLREQPLIVMRTGYLMHRFVHRWLEGDVGSVCYVADGAELGMAMAAEGLGITVLPDFTVHGHPLARTGAVAYLPLAESPPTVTLVSLQRPGGGPRAVRDLETTLVRRARDYTRGGGVAVP